MIDGAIHLLSCDVLSIHAGLYLKKGIVHGAISRRFLDEEKFVSLLCMFVFCFVLFFWQVKKWRRQSFITFYDIITKYQSLSLAKFFLRKMQFEIPTCDIKLFPVETRTTFIHGSLMDNGWTICQVYFLRVPACFPGLLLFCLTYV